MTDEELEAKFNELGEHADARSDLALAAATELIAVFAGILIRRGVCTPRNVTEYLDLISEDAKQADQDSAEMKTGKHLLAKAIGLLRLRLSQIEAARERGDNSPTLQ